MGQSCAFQGKKDRAESCCPVVAEALGESRVTTGSSLPATKIPSGHPAIGREKVRASGPSERREPVGCARGPGRASPKTGSPGENSNALAT